MKTGGARDFKVQLMTADGGRATVEISSAPMRSSDHAIGVFGLAVPQQRGQANAHPKHRLTRRQSEVLHLLGAGSSTEQMAETLHLSQQTVRNHVRHVLQALGAHSRLQAVAIAHREGSPPTETGSPRWPPPEADALPAMWLRRDEPGFAENQGA